MKEGKHDHMTCASDARFFIILTLRALYATLPLWQPKCCMLGEGGKCDRMLGVHTSLPY